MPAGLDLLSPGGEGRVPRNARRDFHGEVQEYFRLIYQRDRILGKVAFRQNHSASHNSLLQLQTQLVTNPARSTRLVQLPLRLCLVMPLHIHNATATEAAPSVDVFKRSATRRDT